LREEAKKLGISLEGISTEGTTEDIGQLEERFQSLSSTIMS
jgi:hypothetical protein